MKTYKIEQIENATNYRVTEVSEGDTVVVVTDLPLKTATLIKDALTLWRDHLGVDGVEKVKLKISKDVEELEAINKNE